MLGKYMASLLHELVFFSNDVQTTTLALAITSSICCSVVWLVVTLVTSSVSRSQSKTEKLKDFPKRAICVERREQKRPWCVDRHSITGSQFGVIDYSTITLHVKKRHKQNYTSDEKHSSPVHLQKCHRQSEKCASIPCIRCGMYTADRQCEDVRCKICCNADQSSHCNFHSNSFHCIASKAISIANHQPSEVDLSYLGLHECPERLGFLGGQLTCLNLSNNRLQWLPQEIGCLRGLHELYLQYNSLQELPFSLGNLNNLRELDVKNNSLCQLPPSVGRLAQLRALRLMNNQLKHLPESIGNLSRLEELNLQSNKLSALPKELCNLTCLTQLYLGDNLLDILPDRIGNLVRLQEMDISRCALTSLPQSLGYCTSLTSLWLSNNRLKQVPSTLGDLQQLKELHMKQNNLKTLPASLTFLKLYTFTASHNPFMELVNHAKLDNKCMISSKDRIPTLQELTGVTVICQKISWQKSVLPAVLRDMLENVQYCDQCRKPMFSHHRWRLRYKCMGLQKVPLHQQICNRANAQGVTCRFLEEYSHTLS